MICYVACCNTSVIAVKDIQSICLIGSLNCWKPMPFNYALSDWKSESPMPFNYALSDDE